MYKNFLRKSMSGSRLNRLYDKVEDDAENGVYLVWLMRVPNPDGIGSKRWIKWHVFQNEVDQINAFYLYDAVRNILLKTIPADKREISIDDVAIGTYLSIYTSYKDGNKVESSRIYNAPETSFPTPGLPPPNPEDLSWYGALDQSTKDILNKNNVLNIWLETTARYDSNLSLVFFQNGIDIVWRSDNNRILFHGDEIGRGPDEIFSTGLAPVDPLSDNMKFNTDVNSALQCMSYNAYIARSYVDDSFPYYPAAGYLYLTNAPQGVNVPTWDYSESEIDYPGGVRSEFVMGCFICNNSRPDDSSLPVAYRPNVDSHFYRNGGNFGNAPEGMVDIFISTSTKLANIQMRFDDGKGHVFTSDQQIIRMPAKGKCKVSAFQNNLIADRYWYKNFTMISPSDMDQGTYHSPSVYQIDLENDPFVITDTEGKKHKILILSVVDPYS